MRVVRTLLITLSVVALLATAAYFTRDRWALRRPAESPGESVAAKPPAGDPHVLKISPEARRNLGLVVKPLRPSTYWRSIQVPGMIVDRPGVSDRGVTSPAVAVVAKVHHFPGDTVKPGEIMFTLRVFSEYLQNTQAELFRATKETELVREQKERIEGAAKTGAVPMSRVIELENQLRRQAALIQSYRQDLLTRGLNSKQIDGVAEGTFVSTIDVSAPPAHAPSDSKDVPVDAAPFLADGPQGLAYEVQDLKVDLGEQVQAGQLLCLLANHRSLFIEGHAFKEDAPLLERAAQNKWPVDVEFEEDAGANWPTLDQTFRIRHLSNSVDPVSRTFDFFLPLTNASRSYDEDGRTFAVWRFRPGQRARLHVPVEELKDAIVLPAAAVVREGPEAYVFRQNGDLFDRRPVQVLYEDRRNVILARGPGVVPGQYIAQNGAASLNRVMKAQAGSGMPANVHVHADGTVHANH